MTAVDAGEIAELRRALGGIAALSSLPAIWVDASERQIVESLADEDMHHAPRSAAAERKSDTRLQRHTLPPG